MNWAYAIYCKNGDDTPGIFSNESWKQQIKYNILDFEKIHNLVKKLELPDIGMSESNNPYEIAGAVSDYFSKLGFHAAHVELASDLGIAFIWSGEDAVYLPI